MNIDDLITNINNKELFDSVLKSKNELKAIFNSQYYDKQTSNVHSSLFHYLYYKKVLTNNNQKNIEFHNFFMKIIVIY